MQQSGFYTRQFSIDDVPSYKAMRLEALRNDPGMFGNSYDMEAAMPDQEWITRVTDTRFARFGLYKDSELIGLTGIVIDKDEPTHAHMTQSYIRPMYRGQKLSRLLYDTRIHWARLHGINKLFIMHRDGNAASRAANQHYKFAYTHREPHTWPDGEAADMVCYELWLE